MSRSSHMKTCKADHDESVWILRICHHCELLSCCWTTVDESTTANYWVRGAGPPAVVVSGESENTGTRVKFEDLVVNLARKAGLWVGALAERASQSHFRVILMGSFYAGASSSLKRVYLPWRLKPSATSWPQKFSEDLEKRGTRYEKKTGMPLCDPNVIQVGSTGCLSNLML